MSGHVDSVVECWCWDAPDLSNPHPRRCPNAQPHDPHDWWDEHEPDATKWACSGVPGEQPTYEYEVPPRRIVDRPQA